MASKDKVSHMYTYIDIMRGPWRVRVRQIYCWLHLNSGSHEPDPYFLLSGGMIGFCMTTTTLL